MKFNFQFGPKKRTIVDYAVIGIILSSLVIFLASALKIDQSVIWRIIDQIQRELVRKGILPQNNIINDYTIKTPELLQNRIKHDVDDAIWDATPEYDSIINKADARYKPRIIQEQNDDSVCYSDECKALAPPIRICSPVVEGINCPNEIIQ